MAFVSLRQMLDHAAENGYGVPAFNVNNLEQIQAIMEAAALTDSPVILQASAGARKYAGEAYLRHMVLAAVETYPDIPVVMHQDHGTTAAVCQQSIRSGFTSVMMDGSLMGDGKTPASYEYNVDVTRKVCEMAHAVGVSVEGELGCLGSLETGDAGEEDGVVDDRETIEATLNTISTDDDIVTKFLEAVKIYIDDSTVQMIALPSFNCPKCQAPMVDEERKHPLLIPLEPNMLFFTLRGRRLSRAKTH